VCDRPPLPGALQADEPRHQQDCEHRVHRGSKRVCKVNHRGLNILVAEQLLDRANVGADRQQVRGERLSKGTAANPQSGLAEDRAGGGNSVIGLQCANVAVLMTEASPSWKGAPAIGADHPKWFNTNRANVPQFTDDREAFVRAAIFAWQATDGRPTPSAHPRGRGSGRRSGTCRSRRGRTIRVPRGRCSRGSRWPS